jgi:hypothetical protein
MQQPLFAATRTRAKARPRDKVFGIGRCVPLDRNAKARIAWRARALMRRDAPGRHYGAISAKAYAVLLALLYGFHNSRDGRCFPSHKRIAERADCVASTVALALKALEVAGVLTWQNRIQRVRERVDGLFGPLSAWRWRIYRTSNAYQLIDPQPCKSDFQTETQSPVKQERGLAIKESNLATALHNLGRAIATSNGFLGNTGARADSK